ncbi:HpcH/HpaI aldolase/citrate lyase family protein [Falsirhodobacter deserti]|uniref:HpcH/HpaI aldolase/citrate lyase family protein n=1 Tax=Falsirhodobacter deserti TaxID=1365611 RepID=UPI000FE3F72D|nr:CoA ester lyase [Falsirhodobacter deserti]
MTARLLRSVLYVPATNLRAMAKARDLPCDAIIFDLEDAVTHARKNEARALLGEALRGNDYGRRLRLVRVNTAADIPALADLPMDGIVLPKVVSADLPDAPCPLWVMMETVLAVLNAPAIAAHASVAGLILGTNDLARELRLPDHPDRLGLHHALGTCVLAARAAGKAVIDGVHTSITDTDALVKEARQGRDMGFDGKTVIHPSQIAPVNEVFSPSAEAVALARAQIVAHEEAEARGDGVAVMKGRIVEALHVEMARRTLALHEAITP